VAGLCVLLRWAYHRLPLSIEGIKLIMPGGWAGVMTPTVRVKEGGLRCSETHVALRIEETLWRESLAARWVDLRCCTFSVRLTQRRSWRNFHQISKLHKSLSAPWSRRANTAGLVAGLRMARCVARLGAKRNLLSSGHGAIGLLKPRRPTQQPVRTVTPRRTRTLKSEIKSMIFSFSG
jgi:hypothetical protein